MEGGGKVFRWKPAAWLRVAGPDAFTFLQGQFSNDLRELETKPAVYGLWLNHKGRVLADSFIVRAEGPEAFWVGSYFSPAAVIRERLEAFIIADDVTVMDETDDWAGLTVWGNAGEHFLGETRGAVRVFAGRRSGAPHWEIVFPVGEADAMWARFAEEGAKELEAEAVVRERILAGLPAVPQDIGPGELPNEGQLETDAVSYTKGCYLGQEVMARLKAMGQVRRRLLRVRGSEMPEALPAELFQGERRVAELRSAVADADGFVGLALVSLINIRGGERLSGSPNGDGVIELVDQP